jgi:7-cyano-7-deazaguanine synthase
MTRSALVLFSAGQDSTVCLASALARYDRVETIGFDYGQRHAVELQQRPVVLDMMRRNFPAWSERLGPDRMVDLAGLGDISETALTREQEIAFESSGLPSTFVPGRNLLFLTMAGALAYRRGIGVLIGGMCETDFSGYPDCRRTTMDAMQAALSLGLDRDIIVETPLMFVDKAGAWAMARELGGDKLIDIVIEHTHTCYLGDRGHRHTWGYGCGRCPACELRAKGWADYAARLGR